MIANIITIGDELLNGQTIDTNSSFIAEKLGEIGIKIKYRRAIADDVQDIVAALEESMSHTQLTIITGGLGPTKDDITKHTLRQFFKADTKIDEPTLEHVRSIFENRGLPFTEVNQLQAQVPSNCDVLFNKMGTAPGMWFDERNHIFVSLPGVPFEMKYLMVHEVIPKIHDRFQLKPIIHRHIQTASVGESFLARTIEDIENQLPENIKLAYLPSFYRVNLRLSAIDDRPEVKDQLSYFKQLIRERLHDVVYGHGTKSIYEYVHQFLIDGNQQISFAESCTGGNIAHQFTLIEGASNILKGAWVVYSNEFKEQQLGVSKELLETHTEYSHECVEAMAKGALMHSGANYVIATSGIMTPNLEAQSGKPMSTVYIAFGSRERIVTKQLSLIYNRSNNIEAASIAAVFHLYMDFMIHK